MAQSELEHINDEKLRAFYGLGSATSKACSDARVNAKRTARKERWSLIHFFRLMRGGKSDRASIRTPVPSIYTWPFISLIRLPEASGLPPSPVRGGQHDQKE
jgi:hypothetical protein